MVKSVIERQKWSETAQAYVSQGVTYYYLRVNPIEKDGFVESIEDVFDHMPEEADKTMLYNKWLDVCKKAKIAESSAYAKCEEVKSCTINGVKGWIDSDARTSISKSAKDKLEAGREEYTLYFGGVGFTTTPQNVLDIMSGIEIYASDCYDVTEDHKNNINNIVVIENVESYDITANYPDKPTFTI